MKKSIGVLIAAIILFTTTCGLCNGDSSAIPFTADLTAAVTPDSAVKIVTDSSQRAILTVCLALDFGLSEHGKEYMTENLSSFLFNDSYVASDGSFIVVTGYAGGKCLNMFYEPKEKKATYYLLDVDLSDELMDVLVKSSAEKLPLSYKNDIADLMTVMDVVREATSN